MRNILFPFPAILSVLLTLGVVSTPTEAAIDEEDATFSVFYPFFEVIPTDLVLEDIPIAPETMCTGGD